MLNTQALTGRAGRTRRGLAAGLAISGLLLVAAAFLAGCSAGSASSAASGQAMKAAPAGGTAAALPAANGAAASGAAPVQNRAGTTVRLAPASSIIYTAELTVRAASVSSATTQATQIVQSAGGYVSSETASADPGHPSRASASVQLKIPVASYPATLSQLAGRLGTQLALRQQAQDVTQQVADVSSQVTSDEAAIAQLRALLAHAGSVGDLLSVQNQINAEESSLEQMQAQQRALSHETSYATVTLTLLGPAAKMVVRPEAPPSLAGGLSAGWRALRIAASWTLAFLGVVAPFAVVLLVAGFAGYRGRRWFIRRRGTPPAASPASPGSPES